MTGNLLGRHYPARRLDHRQHGRTTHRRGQIAAKYRVLDFAKKRVDLWDVTLVRPLIVIDRQPGESK